MDADAALGEEKGSCWPRATRAQIGVWYQMPSLNELDRVRAGRIGQKAEIKQPSEENVAAVGKRPEEGTLGLARRGFACREENPA